MDEFTDVPQEWQEVVMRSNIPDYMKDGVLRYLQWGSRVRNGSFVRLIFENNFYEAAKHADENNLPRLHIWAQLLYWLPMVCHGSPAKVSAWKGFGPQEETNAEAS